MMWRVLTALDFVTCPEIHFGVSPPALAVGVSMGTHTALGAWAWKFDMRCLLGPIPINTPPVLGHDAGVLRPHVLIDASPLPPTPPLNSALSSTLATACSALKPMFSSSRDLRAGSPGGGPVCTEVLPFGAGAILNGDVPCGIGGPHRLIPAIPTQLQDWSGLTMGDIVGGLAGMAAETFFQAALDGAGALMGMGGGALGARIFGRYGLASGSRLGSKAVGELVGGSILGVVLPAIVGYGNMSGQSMWPGGEMVSQPVQRAVDAALGDASQPSPTPAISTQAPGAAQPGAAQPGAAQPAGSGTPASGGDGASSGEDAGSSSSDGGGDPYQSVFPPGWSPFGTMT